MMLSEFIACRVLCCAALIGILVAADAQAQSESNDARIYFGFAGHYAAYTHDFHRIGQGERSSQGVEELGTVFSISPLWWIGSSTAIELECGYMASSASMEANSGLQYVSFDAWFVMPHFLLSLGTVDSVFSPYAKIGAGLYSGEQDGIPIFWGAGFGASMVLNTLLSIKVELSYKVINRSSGSMVTVKNTWQGVYLTTGVGVGI